MDKRGNKKRGNDISVELASISPELLKGPTDFMEPAIQLIVAIFPDETR